VKSPATAQVRYILQGWNI